MTSMVPGRIVKSPSPAQVVHTLRDWYWARTEIVKRNDGVTCVRKASKGAGVSGPWGQSSLRSEIDYLTGLELQAARCYPELLAAWDGDAGLGYDMAYVENALDAGQLAQRENVTQDQVNCLGFYTYYKSE